jgi:GNAT superfamily N-acetyltransferase
VHHDEHAGGTRVDLQIEVEPIDRLHEHAQISIAFVVERIFVVSTPESGLGGIRLTETTVENPWVKDYDAIKGEGPTRWAKRFDVSNWGLIGAYEAGRRIGGAVIAFKTPEVHLVERRGDMAVLWDLRVVPDWRSAGVGSALFRAAETWSKRRGCRELRVETQNNNVPACRFYAQMGCSLGAISQFAYPDLPDETQLLWFKQL